MFEILRRVMAVETRNFAEHFNKKWSEQSAWLDPARPQEAAPEKAAPAAPEPEPEPHTAAHAIEPTGAAHVGDTSEALLDYQRKILPWDCLEVGAARRDDHDRVRQDMIVVASVRHVHMPVWGTCLSRG